MRLIPSVLAACVLCGLVTPLGAEGTRNEIVIYAALRPDNWDLYLFDSPEAEPKRLTDDVSLDYNVVFSPDGRYVVFCSERRGNADLFAIELSDPGVAVPLTDSPALDDAPTFSPDGKHLAFVSTRDGNADVFLMPFDPTGEEPTERIVNLTRHRRGDFNPAFSPDGRRIAFSSDRDHYRAGDIYVMDSDGTSAKRLTDSDAWDGSPAWSADGETIYFYSEREKPARIFAVSAEGGEARAVSPPAAESLSPAVAPDGRVAFTTRSNDAWRVMSVMPTGSGGRLESNTSRDYWAPAFDPSSGKMICHGAGPTEESEVFASNTPGRFLIDNQTRVELPDRQLTVWAIRGFFPSLDPTIRRLACSSRFDYLLTCRLDGADARAVFRPMQGSAWRPSWSKDGVWITVGVGPTFGRAAQNVDIWKFRADGSEAVNLTAASPSNNAFPDFSPDGKSIVFRSGREGNHDLFLMDADGENVRRLTDDPGTETMPAFAPDGDMIAFTSTRDDGDYEIYTLKLDDDANPGALLRVTHSPGRDTHPKFSPDGRWLVFASERGGINDEEPLIPVFNPQPYGDIYALRLADGLVVRLCHNKWEDGTPTWGRTPDDRAPGN